jgi:hypothetical protein
VRSRFDSWYATNLIVTSLNAGANPSCVCVSAVLFIRNYSLKRTIVQEGRKTSDGETPSGAFTPVTREASGQPSEDPQTVEEEKRRISASDLEKGLNEGEDATVDAKDEKDEKR